MLVVDANQVETVLFGTDGVASADARDRIVVVSSTVDPSYVEALAPRLADAEIALLDAPVGTANDAASSSAASEFALAPPSTSEEPVGESGNGRATKDDGPKAASPRRKRSA